MAYYTYPVAGFGFMPDPDSVQDHDTIEDAYAAFLEDVRVTCEQLELEDPTNIPNIGECVAGAVYGLGGWLHVIGQD